MSKLLSSVALSALVLFMSYSADAGPRGRSGPGDGRSEAMRARLAARASARNPSSSAQPKQEVSGGVSRLLQEFLSSSKKPMPAASKQLFDYAISGPVADLNFSCIQSLVYSSVDAFRVQLEEVASSLKPFTEDAGDKDPAFRDLLAMSDTVLAERTLRNLVEKSAPEIEQLYDRQLFSELSSSPRNFPLVYLFALNQVESTISVRELLHKNVVKYLATPFLKGAPLLAVDDLVHATMSTYDIFLSKNAVAYNLFSTFYPVLCLLEAIESPHQKIKIQQLRQISKKAMLAFSYEEEKMQMAGEKYTLALSFEGQDHGQGKGAIVADFVRGVAEIDERYTREQATIPNRVAEAFRYTERTVEGALAGIREQEQLQRRMDNQELLTAIRLRDMSRKPESAAAAARDSSGASAGLGSSTHVNTIDELREWWLAGETEPQSSARHEALARAAELEAREQEKAERKATKDRPESGKSEEGASAAAAGEVSLEEDRSAVRVSLSSNHFKLFQRIMSDDGAEPTMDEIISVVEAPGVGGFADSKRQGSRMHLALRHPVNGKRVVRSIHNHLSRGHSGLEGGRMKSVRGMFEEAGFTLETVFCKDVEDGTEVNA